MPHQALYTLQGVVVAGKGYGRNLGFPTANLTASRDTSAIPPGIYAGTARIVKGQKLQVDSSPYPAGIVIGPRDRRGVQKVEAHLLDFSGNLYGGELKLQLQFFLREFREFASEDGLKEAIVDDLAEVRKRVHL